MSNIWKIMQSDFRRLSTNVVAIVFLMGLTVIPCLYAWFNILSNWDPYGEEATSGIKVAIATDDKGTSLDGVEINISDNIMEALKTNKTIGWVFPDTTDAAVNGVYSGDYYAALILPENFSANMVSFLAENMEHPQIIYYVNQKRNAIAPKITDKAKNAVKQQVNSTFISTLAKTLVETSDTVENSDAAASLGVGSNMSVMDVLIGKLELADTQLTAYNAILDSFVVMLDSASGTVTGAGGSLNVDEVIARENGSIAELQGLLSSGIIPMSEVEKSLGESLTSLQNVLGSISNAYTSASGSIGAFNAAINEGKGSLAQTQTLLTQLQAELEETLSHLYEIRDGSSYDMLMALLNQDPEAVGDFMAAPVDIATEKFYEIATYGSAMTPFYVTLSIWVGGLILVAIVHAKVKPEKEIQHLKPYEAFFGRYAVFFVVGQLQTLLTVLGCLFFIRIQCLHPILFWFASAITSFVYTLFMYALTVAFENIGEALAVVVMVVQVAGAGGTFPIEVLPNIYQVIYKYLPFNYSMNALRETIGGMEGAYYWKCLAVLMIFAAVALFIGLVLSGPCRRLNHMIEKSKEKSGVML